MYSNEQKRMTPDVYFPKVVSFSEMLELKTLGLWDYVRNKPKSYEATHEFKGLL